MSLWVYKFRGLCLESKIKKETTEYTKKEKSKNRAKARKNNLESLNFSILESSKARN
jgi:hypothetical protein